MVASRTLQTGNSSAKRLYCALKNYCPLDSNKNLVGEGTPNASCTVFVCPFAEQTSSGRFTILLLVGQKKRSVSIRSSSSNTMCFTFSKCFVTPLSLSLEDATNVLFALMCVCSLSLHWYDSSLASSASILIPNIYRLWKGTIYLLDEYQYDLSPCPVSLAGPKIIGFGHCVGHVEAVICRAVMASCGILVPVSASKLLRKSYSCKCEHPVILAMGILICRVWYGAG